jgi:translation initiation factor 3 subunit M
MLGGCQGELKMRAITRYPGCAQDLLFRFALAVMSTSDSISIFAEGTFNEQVRISNVQLEVMFLNLGFS